MVSTWLPSLRSTILLIVVQILLVSNPSQASRSRGYYDDNNNIDNNNNNYNNNDNNYYDSYKPAYTHDDYEPPTEVYMPYHNPTPTSPPWNPTPTSPPWNSPPTSPSWNPTPASPPWKPPTSPPWNPPPNSPPITSPPWNPTPTSPPWNPPPNSPPWNPPTSPPWNPPPTSPPSSTPWNPPPNSPPWNPPTSPPWNPPPTSPPSSPPWNPPSTNPTPTNPPRNPTPTNPPRPPPNKDVQAESSPDKTAFLQGHNRARADVGLPPMIWDDKVAAYAQWWANQRINDCRVVHSDTNYGENIFWGSGGYSAAFAVQSWVNERKHYDYNSNSCRRGMDCGHYTQIVWRKSTRVGCARVRCNNGGVFITCNYDPPGNYVGSRPY